MHYSAVHYSAVNYSAVHYSAVMLSALKCSAVWLNAVEFTVQLQGVQLPPKLGKSGEKKEEENISGVLRNCL